jgi:hypothetical protein
MAILIAGAAGCGRDSPPSDPGPLPLIIEGQVMEPAANVPVEGVQLCWAPGSAGGPRCTLTRPDGTYRLVTERLPATVQRARLAPYLSKEGYESRQTWVDYDPDGFMQWSPGFQRMLRIDAGQSLEATVYPQEGSGSVEGDSGWCDGCKRVRIAVGQTGELTLRFAADDERLRLVLPYVQMASPEAPIAVRSGEEIVAVIVGATAPMRFALSTSLTTAASR